MRFVSLESLREPELCLLVRFTQPRVGIIVALRADIPPERRAGGGWAAVVSIINLKFSAATAASASAVGEEIERTKQLEMAHCAHHYRDGKKSFH